MQGLTLSLVLQNLTNLMMFGWSRFSRMCPSAEAVGHLSCCLYVLSAKTFLSLLRVILRTTEDAPSPRISPISNSSWRSNFLRAFYFSKSCRNTLVLCVWLLWALSNKRFSTLNRGFLSEDTWCLSSTKAFAVRWGVFFCCSNSRNLSLQKLSRFDFSFFVPTICGWTDCLKLTFLFSFPSEINSSSNSFSSQGFP